METPECDKLSKISDVSQSIGAFLDWIQEEYGVDLPKDINSLLSEYFEIDLNKVEEEKQAILEHMRSVAEEVT